MQKSVSGSAVVSPTSVFNMNSPKGADLHGHAAQLAALRVEFHTTLEERVLTKLNDIENSVHAMQNINSNTNENVVNPASDIFVKINDFRKEIFDIKNAYDYKINIINDMLKLVNTNIDDLDQVSRSNTLLIHGVKEEHDEKTQEPLQKVCDVVSNLLELPDSPRSSIDCAFRLGPKRSLAQLTARGPRPIVVKFVTNHTKMEVFMAKRKLKEAKIFISESLTPTRQKLLSHAKEKYGMRNAWSINGQIMVAHDNLKRKINRLEDLQ